MPKKPTRKASLARSTLLRLVAGHARKTQQPLPVVRELAAHLGISYSTVSRLLNELSQEGTVWQHPNGRFYPRSAQIPAGRGLPIALVGRQMQNWSQLYRETIEGLSEVCTALGSPLILLSSDRLVNHPRLEYPPLFATESAQRTEFKRLEGLIPRPCAAVIFDHLWLDSVLGQRLTRIASPQVILMRDTALPDLRIARPDFLAGSQLLLRHLIECGYEQIQLVLPFEGDASVSQCAEIFQQAVQKNGGKIKLLPTAACATPSQRKRLATAFRGVNLRIAVVVPEDNIAMLLAKDFEAMNIESPGRIGLASLQGTSAASAPLTRVRYDYRRLGRSVAQAILSGETKDLLVSPALVEGRSTIVLPRLAHE